MQNNDFARLVGESGQCTVHIVRCVHSRDIFRTLVIGIDRHARHAPLFDPHRDTATNGSQPGCKLIRTTEGRQLAARHNKGFLRRIFRQVMVGEAGIGDSHGHPVVAAVQRAETADVAAAGGSHQFRIRKFQDGGSFRRDGLPAAHQVSARPDEK